MLVHSCLGFSFNQRVFSVQLNQGEMMLTDVVLCHRSVRCLAALSWHMHPLGAVVDNPPQLKNTAKKIKQHHDRME
jgi:hypothetical protein